jgi:hypothetical protein
MIGPDVILKPIATGPLTAGWPGWVAKIGSARSDMNVGPSGHRHTEAPLALKGFRKYRPRKHLGFVYLVNVSPIPSICRVLR